MIIRLSLADQGYFGIWQLPGPAGGAAAAARAGRALVTEHRTFGGHLLSIIDIVFINPYQNPDENVALSANLK